MAGESPSTDRGGTPDAPALVPQGHHLGKPPIGLGRAVTLIGGRHNAHIHLVSRQVSKAHALVLNDDGRIYIRDLASRTHTFVNEREIRDAQLEPGDSVRIGSFKFKLSTRARRGAGPGRRAPAGAIESPDAELPVPLEDRVVLIGRRSLSDIALLEESASTAHAVVFELGGRRLIRDLGSRTGTFVNGRKIHQQVLDFGDQIRIGQTTMRYVQGAPAPAEPPFEADELEHLVGTAPLAPDALDRAADAIERSRPQEDPQEQAPVQPPAELPPPADDRTAAPPVPDEPVDLPVAEPRLDEIDLADDPDVSGGHDTRSLPPVPQRDLVPGLSEQVVDEVDIADDAEPSQLLVAGDLVQEKLSSSLTHGGVDISGDTVLDESPPTQEPAPADPPPALADAPPETPREAPPEIPREAPQPVAELEAIDFADLLPPAPVQPPALERPEPPPVDFQTPPTELESPVSERPLIAEADLDLSLPEPPASAAQLPRSGDKPARSPKSRRTRRGKAAGREKGAVQEILEPTEPTPESAQGLEATVDGEAPATAAQPAELTDSIFGAQMQAFAEIGPEPVVQPPPEPPAAIVPLEAPAPAPVAPLPEVERIQLDPAAEPPAPELPPLPVPEPIDFGAEPQGAIPPIVDYEQDAVDVAPPPAREDAAREEPEFVPRPQADLAPPESAPESEEVAPAPESALGLDDVAPAPESAPESEEVAPAPEREPPMTYLGGMPLSLSGGLSIPTQPASAPPSRTPAAPDEAAAPDTPAPVPDAQPPADTEHRPANMLPPRPRLATKIPRDIGREVEEKVFASPFADEAGPDSHAFDGLAMGPVNELDVFSQLPLPADDDPILGRGGAANSAASARPDKAAPISDSIPEASTDKPRAAPSTAPDAPDAPANARRGPRRPGAGPIVPPPHRRPVVPMLLLTMLLCIALAGIGIWFLLPPGIRVQGAMLFNNAGAPAGRLKMGRLLHDVLQKPETRESAQAIFRARAQRAPGFLADPVAFARHADRAGFPAAGGTDGPAAWLFTVESADALDAPRVEALMLAIYNDQAVAGLAGAYRAALGQLETLRSAIAASQAEVDQRTREIADLEEMLHGRFTAEQLQPLTAEVARLESQWHQAMEAVVRLESELQTMRQAPAPAAADSGAAGVPDDIELRNMNATLADLRARLEAARGAGRDRTDAARKALDDSIEQLRTQIVAVQAQMNGSPELQAYVAAVQGLQLAVGELTAELLRNQKEQVDRIAALKRLLDEKMVARRNRIWESDKELEELREQEALTTRQYNAALSGGLETAEAASRLLTEVQRLRTQIDQRRRLLGTDKDYEEAIAQLQEVIDLNQKRLLESRKRVDETLERMQAALAAAQPAMDQLPQEQKALAAELEKRLAAMNEARRQYAASTEGSVAGDAEATRLLSEEIAALQQRIDRRAKLLIERQNQHLNERQELARLKTMEARRVALTDAQKAKAEAGAAYLENYKLLEDARTAQKRRNDALTQRDQAQKELALRRTKLEALLNEAPVAYPDEPKVLQSDAEMDMRSTYALGSSICIIAVFSILILLASRQSGARPVRPLELGDVIDRLDDVPPDELPASANSSSAHPSAKDQPLAV